MILQATKLEKEKGIYDLQDDYTGIQLSEDIVNFIERY